ncbi:MAG: hypothetical protein AB7F99_14670 [Vicinamibacterales bacterium]
MANEKRNENRKPDVSSRWQKPSLKYVGNVNDVFLFPGMGKISNAIYDTGDTPFKPKGQG